MIKVTLLYALVSLTVLLGQTVHLTKEQIASWQIKTEKPQTAKELPLGEFIVEAVTPPSLLYTISLPFEANVKKLHVAKYQKVTQGLLLAEVTGTEWISIQQQAIANASEFQYFNQIVKRKSILCKEKIIPQKECTTANAQLETYKIKIAASKALLKSFGATDEMIAKLFHDLTLSQTMQVKSNVTGHIVALNATPGKSTSPSDALFIIQKAGPLWLESNLEHSVTRLLHTGQTIHISMQGKTFDATVLQISPVINTINQTRQVRFALPLQSDLLAGFRSAAALTFEKESLKIKKTSVIKVGDAQVVFVKTEGGFSTHTVNILAEDTTHYYIAPSHELQNHIAVSSLAILKNMLGEDDE